MPFVSVCKNVIQSNNKRDWENPEPPIRVASTKSGKAYQYAHRLGILDKNGELVAEILSTTDGKPVIKCGAKVGLVTKYPVVDLDNVRTVGPSPHYGKEK